MTWLVGSWGNFSGSSKTSEVTEVGAASKEED